MHGSDEGERIYYVDDDASHLTKHNRRHYHESLSNTSGECEEEEEDDDDEEDGSLPDGEEGIQCAVKNLYEGPKKCACHINWVDQKPDTMDKGTIAADETPDSKRYAILAKHMRSHKGSRGMELYEVVVQNSILKGLLQDNIKTYPGVTFAAKDVSFKTPFEPFFHSWDKIENAAKEYSDDDPAPYLKRLVEVLENEMEYSIKSHRDNVSHLVITFDLLWTIFKPGDIVFMDDADQARMYQLVSTSYNEERTRFDLTCRYIDWDGTDFGYDYYYQSIQKFDCPQLIRRLTIYPKMYVENLDEVEKTMRDRGRRFCLLSGPDYKYKSYKGPAQRPRSFYDFSAGEAQEYIDGRVVIDAEVYFQYNRDRRIALESLETDEAAEKAEGTELTGDQLLICVPYVRGYSLKRKLWVQLLVSHVSNITWNQEAFKNLILPKQYKGLLLTLVRSKMENKDIFDDHIEGKGQGVIMLLSGDPGVGKTMTAESVAEEMRTPLYMVTAGELGSDVREVEVALGKALQIAARWNAVLLLDEADVFLQERSAHEVERNKLVSIFLRTLEYYTGILFVTTNRLGTIDKAFKSRVDLSFHYPDLKKAAQKKIWKSFVYRWSSNVGSFTDSHWEAFTKIPMNGREIKNAVKLARLLAVRRKQDLAPGHIDEVLHALNGDMWEEDEEESEESQQEGEASEHPAERGIQQLDAAAADANSNRNERVVSTESA